MSLSLSGELRSAIAWLRTGNGILLLGLFTGLFFLFEYATSGLFPGANGASIFSVSPASFSAGGGFWAMAGLTAASGLLLYLVTIVAMRVVTLEDDGTIPESTYRAQMIGPVFILPLTGILFTITSLIGSFILVIPGLFFIVSCFLYGFVVTTQGHGPIASLKQSWGLARGNRLRLLALLIILLIVNAGIANIPTYYGFNIIGTITLSIALVYSFRVTGQVYLSIGGEPYGD